MKFGICNEIFQGWEIDAVLEYTSRLGYNGVEIAPFTLAKTVNEISPAQRQRIRDTAARHHIDICGLHWLLAKTEGFHLTHPDRAIRDRTARYMRDLVDCCGDLGGKVLVLGSPQQRTLLSGVTPEQAWDWASNALQDGVKQAEDRGLVICIEPLGPSETNFINTAAEGVRFARQFQSPAVQIVLDVKAMSSEPKPIPQIIEESWPHFAHFHANDPNLKGPGFGAVDFRPIAAALKEVGYEAYVSVEIFRFEEGPEAIATQSLAYLQKIFRPGATGGA